MTVRRFLCLCILILSFNTLNAESPGSTLVTGRHWVFDALSYLSSECGQTTLAVYAPASLNEINQYLKVIPFESLSQTGQALYEKVAHFVEGSEPVWTSEKASVYFNSVVSVSLRRIGDTDAWFDFDALARYNDSRPLLDLPLQLQFSPYVSIFSDFAVGEGYWSSALADDFTNIPLSADSIDVNVPKTAYLSAGNSFVTAIVGRGSHNYGRTLSGSLIFSDTADRLDYASLTFFSPALRLSITPVQLAPDRFAYFHDLTIRPRPNLTLCFSEASLVHSVLDPRYLNPLMVFHGFAGWRDSYDPDSDDDPVGSQLALFVEYVPVRSLRLYGQFVLNQFQTSYELSNSADAAVTPNALGGMAGLEWTRPYRKGYLSTVVEGVYTNPWLYVLSNREISYYWSRKELVAPSGYPSQKIQSWLGSPLGPDCIAANLSLSYNVPSEYKVAIHYRFLARGSNGDLFLSSATDDYYPQTVDEARIHTPSGEVSYQQCLTLSGYWNLTERLEITGKLGYSHMNGTTQASSLGAEFSLSQALW